MANKITSNGTTIEVGMNLNTTKAYSQFSTAMNKFRKEGVITTEIEIDGDRFTKAIRQYKDDMGNLIERTTLFSRSWGQVYDSITKVETPIDQVTKKEKELAEQTKQAAQQQEKFNATVKKSKTVLDDFIDTFLKMAKFNTINMIYDGLIDSMSDAIEIVKNFNDVMTEFKKVSDLQGESLQNYTAELGELGSTVARTTSEMVEGATSFKKSGFTDEDSAKLAQLSAMFQNIADEELEASEAANILISVMKGFDIGVENAEHIADTINEVKLFVTSLNRVNCGKNPMMFVSYNVI